MEDKDLKYKIALTLLPGIGSVRAKNLIAYCGGAEAIFKEKKKALLKIPGVGEFQVDAVLKSDIWDKVEEEIFFIKKNNVEPIFFTDGRYPNRLKYCEDSPVLLYFKGKADFNSSKVISIVGTRNATDYGKEFCKKFVEDLKPHNALIISGLAYGIDIHAHKYAVANGLPTVACLAHGLDRIYPSVHSNIAESMLDNGGLLSEYMSETNPDKENFPTRNRIVAGLSDATVVIEAGVKGGALITAEIANSYSRDVFAVPGKIGEPYSAGCNHLIKINKAALIESVKDLEYIMGWQKETAHKPIQQKLFVDLSPEEKILVNILKEKGALPIDNLCVIAKLNTSKTATLLLNLEFSGIVKSLPGKIYQLN